MFRFVLVCLWCLLAQSYASEATTYPWYIIHQCNPADGYAPLPVCVGTGNPHVWWLFAASSTNFGAYVYNGNVCNESLTPAYTYSMTPQCSFFTGEQVQVEPGEIPTPLAPVSEPVSEPITPPVSEPVTPPILSPITPPINMPTSEPVAEPENTPLSSPVAAPVALSGPSSLVTQPTSRNTPWFAWGIPIIVIFAVLIIAALLFFLLRRRRCRKLVE